MINAEYACVNGRERSFIFGNFPCRLGRGISGDYLVEEVVWSSRGSAPDGDKLLKCTAPPVCEKDFVCTKKHIRVQYSHKSIGLHGKSRLGRLPTTLSKHVEQRFIHPAICIEPGDQCAGLAISWVYRDYSQVRDACPLGFLGEWNLGEWNRGDTASTLVAVGSFLRANPDP